MDLDSFGYSKAEVGKIEVSPDIEERDGISVSEESGELDLKEGYMKDAPTVETVHVFIISGGEDKERDYFRLLCNAKSPRLKVIFISKKHQGLTPTQMKQEAEEGIEEECFCDMDNQLSRYFDGDKIFMVTDVDHYRRELLEQMAEINLAYQWIISNPCFEIWLFYHYFENPGILRPDWPDEDRIKSQHLKSKLNELRKSDGGVNAEAAYGLMDRAIVNSKKNYGEDSEGIPEDFATQMHIIGEMLMGILRDDFEGMLVGRAARARKFLGLKEREELG